MQPLDHGIPQASIPSGLSPKARKGSSHLVFLLTPERSCPLALGVFSFSAPLSLPFGNYQRSFICLPFRIFVCLTLDIKTIDFIHSFEFGVGGTKMSKPSEITRDRILKTAVRLFAERGYEATSIRTLAAKAHVNQAAINYHFKTKDGLYREILHQLMPFRRSRRTSSPTPRKNRQCRASALWLNSSASS